MRNSTRDFSPSMMARPVHSKACAPSESEDLDWRNSYWIAAVPVWTVSRSTAASELIFINNLDVFMSITR